jgi:hypothetical protein
MTRISAGAVATLLTSGGVLLVGVVTAIIGPLLFVSLLVLLGASAVLTLAMAALIATVTIWGHHTRPEHRHNPEHE